MKKIFFKLALVMSLLLIVSCNKDDNKDESTQLDDPTAKQLAQLKPVSFPEEAPKILSEETLASGKKLITIRKQVVLNPMQLVNQENAVRIYPGSVLRGDSFLEGKYDPVVINNPREITISTSLQGKDLEVKAQALPQLSDIRQKINDLLKNNQDKIDAKNAPSYMSFITESVNSISSFNKVFRLHVGADIIRQLVEIDFKFQPSNFHTENTGHLLIKLQQPLYNIAVDPKEASQWGELKNVGDVEPVYVSSVEYGRVAHLLLEVKNTDDISKKIIEAGVQINLIKKIILKVDISGYYEKTTRDWFSQNKIKVLVAGGPLGTTKIINNYDSFMESLKSPSAESLIQSAVPIGYKVRTLKDNKEVEVRFSYTDEVLN